MNHLMIDLETLGTAPNAPVLSIGAVFFDPSTGELGRTFEESIDVEDAMQFGRLSGSTFKWWMAQSDEARKAAIRGTKPAAEVFGAFVRFAGNGFNLRPWGNGASFDISIMDYAIPRILNRPAPWKFWNIRDCRTVKEMADGVVPDYAVPREGTHHTALADAVYQAKWVSHYWQNLRLGVCEQPAPAEVRSTALDL
jgi:hypothetical protein